MNPDLVAVPTPLWQLPEESAVRLACAPSTDGGLERRPGSLEEAVVDRRPRAGGEGTA